MMIKIAKILICIVVIILIGFLQNIVNSQKDHRAKQVLIPILGFLYAISAVIFSYQNFEKVSEWTRTEEFFYNSEIAIVNGMIMASFVLMKLIICPLMLNLCNGRGFLEKTVCSFYAYDEDYDRWFLLQKWVNFRQYFFVLVSSTFLVSGVYLGITWVAGKDSIFWNMVFPCVVTLVLNEWYGFINGQTKEEFEHSIYGDEADARRISNFYKVREVLEESLPEPLLSSHTGFEYIGKETPADLIEEWKKTNDKVAAITAEYFEIDNRYMKSDIDYVQATLQLMNRNNVVFFNPFYRDMELYITLPLVNALLAGKKCVVVTGRRANSQDVKDWLTDVLSKYSHMKSLWRVECFSEKEPEYEVGILSTPQLYDRNIVAINRDFFQKTDFVLLIEPSLIVNTSQIALSIIAQEMQRDGEMPVYCIIDRNTEGLVDTLSHVLRINITNVVSSPIPRCIYTGMSWDADGDFIRQQLFDKQTRYLGNGIELAAIAIKNQIPNVSWYCGTKAPIKDIKWIAGQHHSTICRYMNLPAQQKSLYEKIEFVSNIWNTPTEKEKFLIVEDEFCNMFGMMKAYLSRGISQSFVNVLSENYLLRDYMRCNRQIFMSDPNAVASIVPDYAKTERNILIKLLLQMVVRPVTDVEVAEEFSLIGLEVTDTFEVLSQMMKKYTFVESSILEIENRYSEDGGFSISPMCQYRISKEIFDEYFVDSLKSACFILEEEKQNEGYIDAKLFNHVTQIALPGQFVIYDGKYYMVKSVSPQSGVVLRRASDLYDGRKYYRQIREYILEEGIKQEILSLKTVMDIEIAVLQTNFIVNTTGYLEMRDNHDLRLARKIDFAKDPSVGNYVRKYHNKSMLRIKFPETDDKIRFTICLLLSEIFRTIFSDGWQYLAVVSKRPEDIDGMLNYTVYSVKGHIEEDYIYIIEDSDIDLGLLEAVERNLMKIMEILTDFLEWHFEKMREPAQKDPVPVSINYNEKKEAEKKHTLFVRMAQRINQLFGIKKVEEVVIGDEFKPEVRTEVSASKEEIIENLPEEEKEYTLDEECEEQKTVINKLEVDLQRDNKNESFPDSQKKYSDEDDAELISVEGIDIFDNEVSPEDNEEIERQFAILGLAPLEKTRYQRECYLKFGFDEIDSRLRLDELYKYLRVRSWSNNSLTKARKRDILEKKQLDIDIVNHCDFCGLPLSGVSYEMLNDGRTRCNDCARSEIATENDLRKIFYQILRMMEAIYDVQYKIPIRIGMTDAKKVAKGYGSVYKPSTGVSSRVIGFAQRRMGKYSILMENGAPRLVAIDTIVHEMTHIWQYINWNDAQVINIYRMNCNDCTRIARDIVYEGMAMWASIQYLYQIGETYFAARQEALAEQRRDIYGIGFKLYNEQYPIIKDSALIKYSPFKSFPTLEPEKVRVAVKALCRKEECEC